MRARILVVHDKPDAAKAIFMHLQSSDHTLAIARDGQQALRRVRTFTPDVMVLHWALPDIDSAEICKRLRNDPVTSSMRIVVVSSTSGDLDRVLALEVGADDFLATPFNPRELVLRVKKQLANTRSQTTKTSVYKCGEIIVDVDAYLATVDRKPVALTPTEFKLLLTLLRRLGSVVTREELLDEIWADHGQITPRTIDTHMRRLRQKLGPACRHLATVERVGYRAMQVSVRTKSIGRGNATRHSLRH